MLHRHTAPVPTDANSWSDVADRSARGYTLPHGQTLFLRPVGPEDTAEVVSFVGRLSAETLHLRFFGNRHIRPDRARPRSPLLSRTATRGAGCEFSLSIGAPTELLAAA